MQNLEMKLQRLLLNLMFVLILLQITGIMAADDKKANSATKADYDYDDTGEDDTSSIGTKPLKTTIVPYFEHNITTIYATGEEKITLTCSPKNFDDGHHMILWYKNDMPITNGNNTLSAGYEVDNKFRLTILHYDNETPGNFSCSVMPSQVRQYVVIKPQSEAPENIVSKDKAVSSKQGIQYLALITTACLVFLRVF